MKLVVGLGNPGSKYEGTRHNIGFEVIDRLAALGSGAAFARKFEGFLAEGNVDDHRVLLLKPQTFMNLSGRSVGQTLRFYKLDPADLLVVCDDLSLPLGKLRLRGGGSDGGQKGLKDVTAHLGTAAYPRLRVGIGERGETDRAFAVGLGKLGEPVCRGLKEREAQVLRECVGEQRLVVEDRPLRRESRIDFVAANPFDAPAAVKGRTPHRDGVWTVALR